MRARVFQTSIVVLGTMPLFLASFAACGDDGENDAFGGGDAASTGIASSGTPATGTGSSTTQASSGGDGGGAGDGGAGGAGGSSSSDGGGAGDGGAGGTGAGGEGGTGEGGGATLTGAGGGANDIACSNGCVPFPTDGSGGGGEGGAGNDDCDEDGDPNLTDCQPCNPSVYSGQTAFFGVPFEPFEPDGSPSFDYDCSSSAEVEYPYRQDGCSSLDMGSCEQSPIFTSGEAPICGEPGVVQECVVEGLVLGTCTEDGATTNMTVRCH